MRYSEESRHNLYMMQDLSKARIEKAAAPDAKSDELASRVSKSQPIEPIDLSTSTFGDASARTGINPAAARQGQRAVQRVNDLANSSRLAPEDLEMQREEVVALAKFYTRAPEEIRIILDTLEPAEKSPSISFAADRGASTPHKPWANLSGSDQQKLTEYLTNERNQGRQIPDSLQGLLVPQEIPQTAPHTDPLALTYSDARAIQSWADPRSTWQDPRQGIAIATSPQAATLDDLYASAPAMIEERHNEMKRLAQSAFSLAG